MINKLKNLKKNKLFGNFFSLSILQIFTYILPLLTLPYLVRVLGVETFGLISFATAFIIFFSIFVDYGFNLSATREISINRGNIDKITEIYSSILSIKIILIFLSFLLMCVLIYTFDKFNSHIKLYFLTFVSVIGQGLFPIWYFQGIERMKYITIVNIISKVSFTAAIFIFVKSENDYLLVPLLNGLGIVSGSLYALYIIKKEFNQNFILQNFDTLIMYFKDSSLFFLSRVSESLYTITNTFILGFFTNNTMVGYYAIAEKLYQAMQAVYGPINQVLYPYIAKERNIKLFKSISYKIFIFNIFLIVFFYFFGEQIFSLLFTDKVSGESIVIFKIFLIATFIIVISNLVGYPFLGALGFTKQVNLTFICGAVFHFIGLLLLIMTQNINIFNVAIMVVFTEFMVLSLKLFYIKKNNLW